MKIAFKFAALPFIFICTLLCAFCALLTELITLLYRLCGSINKIVLSANYNTSREKVIVTGASSVDLGLE